MIGNFIEQTLIFFAYGLFTFAIWGCIYGLGKYYFEGKGWWRGQVGQFVLIMLIGVFMHFMINYFIPELREQHCSANGRYC